MDYGLVIIIITDVIKQLVCKVINNNILIYRYSFERLFRRTEKCAITKITNATTIWRLLILFGLVIESLSYYATGSEVEVKNIHSTLLDINSFKDFLW